MPRLKRFQIRKQGEGRQAPWESTSLEDDFYFDPSVQVVKLADSERAKEALQALTRENAEWTRIKESTASRSSRSRRPWSRPASSRPFKMLALRRDVMRRNGGPILADESFQLVSLKRADRPAGS